jgi:hypothetical protein
MGGCERWIDPSIDWNLSRRGARIALGLLRLLDTRYASLGFVAGNGG